MKQLPGTRLEQRFSIILGNKKSAKEQSNPYRDLNLRLFKILKILLLFEAAK